MRNSSADMCEGPLFKKIVIYTVPIMLTGILQLLFNAADLVARHLRGGADRLPHHQRAKE